MDRRSWRAIIYGMERFWRKSDRNNRYILHVQLKSRMLPGDTNSARNWRCLVRPNADCCAAHATDGWGAAQGRFSSPAAAHGESQLQIVRRGWFSGHFGDAHYHIGDL